MLKQLLLFYTTLCYLYAIAVSLMQFYVITKEEISPTFNLSWDVSNTHFGIACSITVTIFLCFVTLLHRLIYNDSAAFLLVDSNPWTKFCLTIFIAIYTLFDCGLYGVISCAALLLSAVFNLIKDKVEEQHEELEDIELADIGQQI